MLCLPNLVNSINCIFKTMIKFYYQLINITPLVPFIENSHIKCCNNYFKWANVGLLLPCK